MKAVRLTAVAFAALALLPATASAATVTITGDDGNPLAINTSAATPLRQLDLRYAVTFDASDQAYHKTFAVGPDGAAASSGSSCYPKSAITNLSRYVDYRGNGAYAVVVQTFTNSACTSGAIGATGSLYITRSRHTTPRSLGSNTCWWCHSAYGPRNWMSMNCRGGDQSMIRVRHLIGTPSQRIV